MKRLALFIISILLILFGISGIAFSLAFIPKIMPTDITNESFNTLTVSVTESFDSISKAMESASSASKNISESVSSAKGSLETASKVTEDAAKAFKEMSKLVDFEILGLKPFESVYSYFQDGGESLSQLSVDLSDTGKSLGLNSSDIEQLGLNLSDISGKINNLSASFDTTAKSISFNQFGKIINYLKIYIAVLHAMFILTGFSIMFIGTKKDI